MIKYNTWQNEWLILLELMTDVFILIVQTIPQYLGYLNTDSNLSKFSLLHMKYIRHYET